LYEHLGILLCDDDLDDCHFFKDALETLSQSAKLTIVHDGEQLMHFLNEINELPDVLFLDLNMPRKNGFECLSEIKLDSKLKHLPVIIFSTSLEQEVLKQLYNNGAQYFIRKPAEFSEIQKILQQALTLVTQGMISQPLRENFVLKVQNGLVD
jgi:CheY-like chemotaxis protein